MSRLWEWLLGLPPISLEAWEGTALRFERSAWLLWVPLLLLAGGLFVAWCYRREPLRPGPGAFLAGIRVAAVVWMAALILRPSLVLRQVHVEPSSVALLVDTSASMAQTDGPGGSTRLDSFRAAWRSLQQSGGLRPTREREWRLYAFDDTLKPGGVGQQITLATLDALQPVGRRTDLGGAIGKLLSEPGGGRLTAIAVVSDGRSTGAADWQPLLAAARRQAVAIHAIRVSPDNPAPTLSIGPVWTAPQAFTFDPIEVRATISGTQLESDSTAHVEIYDTGRGEVLASKPVELRPAAGSSATASAEVRMRLKPLPAGVHRLQVRAAATGRNAVSARPEPVEIEVVEHRLRVLYVEGYPRFEYRYLRTLLARERSLESSCLLLSADPSFVQEGTLPISRFPSQSDELLAFDVIILGDVDPAGSWWDSGRQELLEKFVDLRGGGLVLLAGRRWMPAAVTPGSVLDRLMPVELGERASGVPLPEPSLPVVTATGKDHPLLQIAAEHEAAGWLRDVPGLYWSAPVGRPKPGAVVLLERPATEYQTAVPLLVAGRYGAGRTLFHGSDDTWRWRKEVGETYHDAYWLSVLRNMARSKLLGQDRRLLLQADRQQYAAGEPVLLRLTALDPALAASWPDRATVTARNGGGDVVGSFELSRAGAAEMSGSWTPPGLDRFTLSVDSAAFSGTAGDTGGVLREAVQVVADAEEMRNLAGDTRLLARLAEGSGGVSLRVEELSRLPGALTDRPQRRVFETASPVWDTPLGLLVLVTLLGAEWLGRKRLGLV